MPYEPIIGLEIHIQLKAKSKMFCDCPNGFGLEKEPNVHICPVCTGQPGTLPVINEEAVKMVIKTGVALNCQIANSSFFERKNYFYPDLPKGYQISQYQKPLCFAGWLEIYFLNPVAKNISELESKTLKQVQTEKVSGIRRKIRIRRIHLEEDTGKLIHRESADYSLIDFNRAGVPLMELVTEPDIRSAQEAKRFCQELQLILRYLGVSDADMEKGQMRCEVNISLREPRNQNLTAATEINDVDLVSEQDKEKSKSIEENPSRYSESFLETEPEDNNLGTKVEIKNLNSFRAVERAIDYEIKRQSELLERGEQVMQETRGWDDNKGITYSQRLKEEAHDYRYFPEPDLPPLKNLYKIRDKIATEIPELPQTRRERFSEEYGLPKNDIEILVQNKELGEYFEQVCSELNETEQLAKKLEKEELKKLYKLTANYLLTEIPRVAAKLKISDYKLEEKITPENFAEFIVIIYKRIVSSSGAQNVLEEMFKIGADPTHIIEEKNLAQISDTKFLESIVDEVIRNNPQPVEDYKKGKDESLQFLIGQVMKATKGRANPQLVGEVLKARLKIQG